MGGTDTRRRLNLSIVIAVTLYATYFLTAQEKGLIFFLFFVFFLFLFVCFPIPLL
jgi:hypothetical protein